MFFDGAQACFFFRSHGGLLACFGGLDRQAVGMRLRLRGAFALDVHRGAGFCLGAGFGFGRDPCLGSADGMFGGLVARHSHFSSQLVEFCAGLRQPGRFVFGGGTGLGSSAGGSVRFRACACGLRGTAFSPQARFGLVTRRQFGIGALAGYPVEFLFGSQPGCNGVLFSLLGFAAGRDFSALAVEQRHACGRFCRAQSCLFCLGLRCRHQLLFYPGARFCRGAGLRFDGCPRADFSKGGLLSLGARIGFRGAGGLGLDAGFGQGAQLRFGADAFICDVAGLGFRCAARTGLLLGTRFRGGPGARFRSRGGFCGKACAGQGFCPCVFGDPSGFRAAQSGKQLINQFRIFAGAAMRGLLQFCLAGRDATCFLFPAQCFTGDARPFFFDGEPLCSLTCRGSFGFAARPGFREGCIFSSQACLRFPRLAFILRNPCLGGVTGIDFGLQACLGLFAGASLPFEA